MEPPPGAPQKSRGWIGCAVTILVLIVAALIAIPGMLSTGRSSNDMNARYSIRTLASAEADFRANDRDWNRVNDYWTGDVKGLYTMTSASTPGATDPPLQLIELSIAAADADETFVPAGGENQPLSSAQSCAKAGYWYAALTQDRSVSTPAQSGYKRDTGGSPPMGSCHNLLKFGFVAFPDSTSSGKYVFILDESSRCYRSAITSAARTGTSIPPGLKEIRSVYRDWPDAETLDRYWSKTD